MPHPQIGDYEELSPEEAARLQRSLREKVERTPLEREPRILGGGDVSYDRGSGTVHAAIALLSLPALKLRAYSLCSTEVSFPYIPGLLAFRELPPLWKAWRQCRRKPDVLILDAHGLAHPRRMGLASHFGVLADHPCIGCAKNVLTGEYREPDSEKGSFSWLKEDGEKIGMVLRSRTGVQPIFISPGHKVTFEDTLRVTKQSLGRYKLPETTRTAHRLVNRRRKGELEEGYAETSDASSRK